MAHIARQSTAKLVGLQLHDVLSQFPTVCFILALITDITYWQTANLMWLNFSDWLLFAGLFVGAFAVLGGIVELFMHRKGSDHRPYWVHALGSIVVLILALFNSLVHSGDGWTAVVPWGLTLSALTVILLIVTNFYGRLIASRQHIVEIQEAGSTVYE